jgi:site-specific DNA-methyltransferase (adenine-specific)
VTNAYKRKEVIGNCTLYLGDCLGVLEQVEAVHAVITDPPYSSGARTTAQLRGRGGMSRKEEWKDNPLPNDRLSVTGFTWLMRQVGLEAARLLVPGGSFLSFIDWRQYPTLYGCVESCNLQIINMVVWNKEVFGMGNGFRNQHELILHAANGTPRIFDRSVPNVIGSRRISTSDLHPTEKPVPLIEDLVRVCTDVDEIVLDPFMGSGTTGVACEQTGRKFIGIEIDEGFFDVACERVRSAYRAPKMFSERPAVEVQEALL